MSWEAENEEANRLTRRGMARAEAGELAEALADFEAAIRLREGLDWRNEGLVCWGLAAGLINRGDVLARLGEGGRALASYENAARVLAHMERTPAVRERLGILWNQHGVLLEAMGAREAALGSFRQALGAFEKGNPSLVPVAALLHLSRLAPPEHRRALTEEALGRVRTREKEELAAAEIGIKARHHLCELACELLLAGKKEDLPRDWIAEVSDWAEEGLAVAREWEAQGETGLRSLALDFFRLALRVYRTCQPQFLAEFILEQLDPELSLGAWGGLVEFRAAALGALRQAMAELLDYVVIGEEEIAKRQERLRELRSVDERLAQLGK
ncbi:MAG: hypothetical protein ACQKBY_01535 [Verrucomicrobiales bacterium]